MDRPRTVPVTAKVEKMLLAEPKVRENIVLNNNARNINIHFTKHYKNITIIFIKIKYIRLADE